MSKSFRFFRKHNKVMMAGLVLLCIGLFVFSRGSGSGARGDGLQNGDATVATWNGGRMTQKDLSSLIQQRLIVNEILQRLFVEGGGRTGTDFPVQRIPSFFLQSRDNDQLTQEVVETQVIADLATKAGISVSDNQINEYLKEVGLQNVDTNGVEQILASVGQSGARVNEAITFSVLRKLLLAHYYQQGYGNGGFVVMPEQRWDDWRKVNERISLAVAVLPVDKFVKDVPDPTDAQVEALYNDYKEVEPQRRVSLMGRPLDVPEPGFREPRRVRLQFVMASVAERADKLADSITEKEINDYYERNKRTEFIKSDLFGLGDDEEEETTDADEGAEAPPADAATETPTERAATEATEPPAGEATEQTPAAPPADAAAPAATPAAEPAAPPTTTPADSSSSAVRRPSPFRLAALQTTTTDAAPATESSTEAAPAADVAAKESETTAAEASDAAKSEPPATDGAAADSTEADEEDEEKVEYEPLDKVRDEIKKTLATDKAVQELEKMMGGATAELQTDYNRYAGSVAAAREQNKKLPTPPAKLASFEEMAKTRDLKFDKTAELTARDLSETAVGKAADVQTQLSVLQAEFTSAELFEPILAKDLNGDWYLVSKIEDEPSRVPKLAEVRDEVVKAWKHREAAKLAEKKAQELATEAEKSETPFDEFFKSREFEVIPQTEMFSWRSYPAANPGQGAMPILSEIPELEGVGPQFMDAVFKLDGNRTLGMLNYDNSAAYVVRLNSREYSPDELRKTFLEEVNSWPGQLDLRQEHIYEFSNAARQETLQERGGLKYDEDWIARRRAQEAERE